METQNAPAYFKSNTGYRFITLSESAVKICIPKPNGGYFYKTIGHKKIGEEQALKKAIKERNKHGKRIWSKHWHRVVSNWTLLARLPRNLDPRFQYRTDRNSSQGEYRANWIEWVNNKPIKKFRRYSCDEHGKLGAFMLAKKQLEDAHKDKYELLKFMGRAPIVKLK